MNKSVSDFIFQHEKHHVRKQFETQCVNFHDNMYAP